MAWDVIGGMEGMEGMEDMGGDGDPHGRGKVGAAILTEEEHRRR